MLRIIILSYQKQIKLNILYSLISIVLKFHGPVNYKMLWPLATTNAGALKNVVAFGYRECLCPVAVYSLCVTSKMFFWPQRTMVTCGREQPHCDFKNLVAFGYNELCHSKSKIAYLYIQILLHLVTSNHTTINLS